MKKYLFLLALSGILITGLSGCLGVPREEVIQDDETIVTDKSAVMEDEPEAVEKKITVAETIENFDSYVDSDVDILLTCPEEYTQAAAFVEKAHENGVKELVLLDSEEYGMTLYITSNPDGVNTKTFKDTVDKCIDGAGMKGPLKAYDNYLLWGFPMCSSGVAPTEDQPGYDDFQKCVEISEDILEYLESEDAQDNDTFDGVAEFKCPEEGTTVDCEPLTGEGGEEKAAYCKWVEENCSGIVPAL